MARRFVSKNALVEDPVMVEIERKCINPWSAEEKNISGEVCFVQQKLQ
jgi:nuclear receptor co-repressor 1